MLHKVCTVSAMCEHCWPVVRNNQKAHQEINELLFIHWSRAIL